MSHPAVPICIENGEGRCVSLSFRVVVKHTVPEPSTVEENLAAGEEYLNRVREATIAYLKHWKGVEVK